MKPIRNAGRRVHGFTLVELLVVIAIIGILVALLLPAVQAAREAARRTQCLTQMKNLGLALMNYHDTNGSFPVAFRAPDGDVKSIATSQRLGDGTLMNPNWAIDILPFIEEQSLFDRVDFNVDANIALIRNENEFVRSKELGVMLCPSDAGNSVPLSENLFGGNWARGNYGLNLGLGYFQQGNGDPYDDWKAACGRGIAWINRGAKIAQLSDGTSKTIALAEMRVGVNEFDIRGVWAMPLIGSNMHQRHGSNGTSSPNDCAFGNDDVLTGSLILENAGQSSLELECMGVSSFDRSAQTTSRSQHVGGVMTAFADGSVHFITDFVDTGEPFAGDLPDLLPEPRCSDRYVGVWQALNSANDGFVTGEF